MGMEELKTEKSSKELNFNAYVGSETGFLKGVSFGESTPLLKELTNYNEGDRPPPICALSWMDKTEKELVVSYKNAAIKIYNTKLRAFTQEFKVESNDQVLVGLCPYEGKYLIGMQDGTVSVWNSLDKKVEQCLKVGDHLSSIVQCPTEPSIFATGGKENDLKVWNLKVNEVPVQIYKARNVPHDFLDLRVPVWVQGIAFLPHSTDLVSVCTRYGQVRLYDTKVQNSRPVVNMDFCDHPLMSISTTRNDRQLLLGSAQGKVGLVDVRNFGKEKLVHLFKGFNGSVRSIVADENSPYFVAAGLDRYLYLNHLNQKKPVKKLYLKSRLTSVAITKGLLAELADKTDDLLSVWQNIDLSVLPGPGFVGGTAKTDAPPTKRRKQIV